MSRPVIETTDLHKEFRTRCGGLQVGVNELSMIVPSGGVHGFLGPNGSGKTTTLRMLLGLAHATRGSIRLLGAPVPQHLPLVLNRVGAVVESPKFSPGFTGRQNIQLLARTIGASGNAIEAALDRVGLAGRANDRYKSYSLGMKQRLAIAAALVKDPDLLILDEPTNGLDPSGIREIRETIRGLGEQGVTVLLSSHILAEIEHLCTTVTIIGNGRLLADGRLDELVDQGASVYRVAAPDIRAALRVLRDSNFVADISSGQLLVESDRPAEITRVLTGAGIWFSELVVVKRDLESVFLDLTSGEDPSALGQSSS